MGQLEGSWSRCKYFRYEFNSFPSNRLNSQHWKIQRLYCIDHTLLCTFACDLGSTVARKGRAEKKCSGQQLRCAGRDSHPGTCPQKPLYALDKTERLRKGEGEPGCKTEGKGWAASPQ